MMHVIHIAAEFAPFAKVGGLGDAVFGLTKALAQKGCAISVIIPRYHFIDRESLSVFTRLPAANSQHVHLIYQTSMENIQIYFIEPSATRYRVYDHAAIDIPFFVEFSTLALQLIQQKDLSADILHLHDWHTALIAPLVHQGALKNSKVVFNIHNLEYQGICSLQTLQKYSHVNTMPLLHRYRWTHKINLLKGALICANAIVTVSPSYAKEIMTKKYSCRLLSCLQQQKHKLFGILNGIDTSIWNPASDTMTVAHYHKDMPIELIKQQKQKNKHELQKKVSLPKQTLSLMICVSRFVPQKSPNLILKGLYYASQKNAQTFFLGSAATSNLEKKLLRFAKKTRNNARMKIRTEFNEPLSHLAFAAADFVFIPSRFEPCGLTQLIALRYGCIPIVHKTGGLQDTVFDRPHQKHNGFVANDLAVSTIYRTIDRALKAWYHPEQYGTLIKQGMQEDYSWKRVSEQYLQIYQNIQQAQQSPPQTQ
jgi:starch synthase